MKIIAGAFKGREVPVKHSKELRPTSAKVREALFNIIRQRLAGCSFADLYAGSGAVGLEALSRGAAYAVFVDSSRYAVNAIEGNPVFCENQLNRAVCSDVVRFVTAEPLRGHFSDPFDVVFADAPYNSGEIDRLLPAFEHSWLISGKDSIVVIEHSSKRAMPELVGSLNLLKTYRYGDASLSVYSNYSERGL
ncbi:MAG: 16S rRNA (guanine(966)-N(2))-methyltransferase RsmD [Candidatus Magnetominusculus sp. LBB02]|nr:16S rRNA (guanine(966)-N(2))-methyltransferase RsmD [Candidatus Magnetominusculus sp. LBB02]